VVACKHTHTHTHTDMVEREAIKNTEENGIVFIDEIDKIIDVHRSGTVFPQVLDIVTTFIICIKLNYIVTKIIMI
jgi:ATP-dependent protease HslVU (ClpYQ) ATPase subunit